MSTDTTSYLVTGMTCQHCVDSVTQEVGALDGVTAVQVDLERGELAVTSISEVDRSSVAAAVDEAGYWLV